MVQTQICSSYHKKHIDAKKASSMRRVPLFIGQPIFLFRSALTTGQDLHRLQSVALASSALRRQCRRYIFAFTETQTCHYRTANSISSRSLLPDPSLKTINKSNICTNNSFIYINISFILTNISFIYTFLRGVANYPPRWHEISIAVAVFLGGRPRPYDNDGDEYDNG